MKNFRTWDGNELLCFRKSEQESYRTQCVMNFLALIQIQVLDE